MDLWKIYPDTIKYTLLTQNHIIYDSLSTCISTKTLVLQTIAKRTIINYSNRNSNNMENGKSNDL